MNIYYESKMLLAILEDVYSKGFLQGKTEGINEGRGLEFERILKRLKAAGINLVVLSDA